MRKTFTTIALFAVLGTLAVSCQKENLIDQNGIIGVGEMWGDYFGKKCLNYHYGTNSPCTNAYWFKPQILADIDNQLSDIGPAQIHYVMGTNVTNPNNFKSALISQWGHSEVITQCFSNHGF